MKVALREDGTGTWTSDALSLPSARVLSLVDQSGGNPSFEMRGAVVVVGPGPTTLVANIEISEELVAASALEAAKFELEREKVASADRLARRTLIVTLVTALVSAGAAVAVAVISQGKSDKPAPTAYKDLDQCRDGLRTLKELAGLDKQTLPDLKIAVDRQTDFCEQRLKAALDATSN